MDAFEAVSLPEPLSSTEKKYFSVAQANRALTLVRRIVTDVVASYQQLCELHVARRAFDAKGNVVEAEEARHKCASATDRLSELVEELEKIGCELKGYRAGRVDFAAQRGGREVCLCWKLGEAGVEHWHEVGAGCADRQRITDGWV